MPQWVISLIQIVAPFITAFLQAEVPALEQEGLAALEKANAGLYNALLPILVALKLVPPTAK